MPRQSKEERKREKRLAQEERKKQNKAATPQIPVTAAPQTPVTATLHTPAPQVETPKAFPWAIVISIVALVVSGLSLVVAYLQYDINQHQYETNKRRYEVNQRTQDRTSGKIRAHFTYVDDKVEPASLRPFMKKQDGKDIEVFRLDTIDDLMRWQPGITILNTGDEIIDGIRIEVHGELGHVYGKGVTQIRPMPLFVNEISSAELTSFGKLMPKQKATVYVLPLLLEQMTQTGTDLFPGRDREGLFTVHVLCRIVGVSTYDTMEPRKTWLLGFHWKETVFFSDKQKCEAIINLQPKIVIK